MDPLKETTSVCTCDSSRLVDSIARCQRTMQSSGCQSSICLFKITSRQRCESFAFGFDFWVSGSSGLESRLTCAGMCLLTKLFNKWEERVCAAFCMG